MELLFFGSLTDITQVEKMSMDTIIDTDSLKELLIIKYPGFQKAKYFIAINQQMVHQNTALKQDDIVALMPPFSGG